MSIDWDRVFRGSTVTESTVVNVVIAMAELHTTRRDVPDVIKLLFPQILTPEVEHAIADQPSLDVMNTWRKAASDPATTADDSLAVLRR